MSADLLYFEDFVPGRVFELGSRSVDADEIVAFARQFDPQPFHLDADAAARSIYGGLIASGWHTASLAMRMTVDAIFGHSSSNGSPGVEQLRWLKPVRPGDTLTGTLEVLEAAPSASRPHLGRIKSRVVMRNQRGEPVMEWTAFGIFGRRAEGAR